MTKREMPNKPKPDVRTLGQYMVLPPMRALTAAEEETIRESFAAEALEDQPRPDTPWEWRQHGRDGGGALELHGVYTPGFHVELELHRAKDDGERIYAAWCIGTARLAWHPRQVPRA